MRVLFKLLRGRQMPLVVVDGSSVAHRVETCPADRSNKKNNELDCSGKSKQARCGYDRLSLSTRFAMRNVEGADAEFMLLLPAELAAEQRG